MQFHIRSLLILMVAVSLLCGLVFAAPPLVCVVALCVILWVCPAVWVNGIVFGRGAWRAFFIGGFMAGLGPHLAAVYYSAMLAGGLFDAGALAELMNTDNAQVNLLHAALLLAPGLFAFLGGLTGMTTWRMLQPAKTPAKSDDRNNGAPTADEYVIVSGRLTALAPRERAAPDR
jgi:hypothetical protein